MTEDPEENWRAFSAQAWSVLRVVVIVLIGLLIVGCGIWWLS